VDGGGVHVGRDLARKCAQPVDETTPITVDVERPRWVSRAAEKLEGAFVAFGSLGLTAEGLRCLDVGASTGGFTQVLLDRGAAHVTALDVGHNQLAPEVSADRRVEERSGTTVRGITPENLGGPFDVIVADLSFISLTLVLGTLASLLTPIGTVVLLVKPQFEVGRQRLGKKGIVRSPGDRSWAIIEVARTAREAGLYARGVAASPLLGTEGNAEYLLWLGTDPHSALPWEALVKTADDLSGKGGS
jgi:23S rRNA (cytidine1920-2'-O)/16S rRNA (cytidine1409-2'-O)-methyltransferase